MSPFPLDYLRHILDETGYLIKESAGLSKKDFLQDETLKRATCAVLRLLAKL